MATRDEGGITRSNRVHFSTTNEADNDPVFFIDPRNLFEKARTYLQPGRFNWFLMRLYGARKTFVLLTVHIICTIVVWVHFGIVRYRWLENRVPDSARLYWLQKLAPPFVYGCKHAILLQMALLPLSMSRFTLASLSGTVLRKYIPFHGMMQIHIWLGYTMIALTLFAGVALIFVYSVLCGVNETMYCDRLRSEIMFTGYFIMAFTGAVGATAYLRHRIPYEIFYAVHQIVILIFFLSAAHTLDVRQRRGDNDRSQCFNWIAGSFLFYASDRIYAYINHRYTLPIIQGRAISGSNGARMLILRLHRPALFDFKPGQFAYLRLLGIDNSWHPFSIASGPDSTFVEFYIEVFEGQSWTSQLWSVVKDEELSSTLCIELMGPFGTNLAKSEEFSHALAIGTGTGIVPMISLLKQHIHQLTLFEPKAYFSKIDKYEAKVHELQTAESSSKRSLAKIFYSLLFGSTNVTNLRGAAMSIRSMIRQVDVMNQQEYAVVSPSQHGNDDQASRFEEGNATHNKVRKWAVKHKVKDMEKKAFRAARSIYGVTLLSCLPGLGVALITFLNTVHVLELHRHNVILWILRLFIIAFLLCFGFVALFVWDGTQWFAYIDLIMFVAAIIVDWDYVQGYHAYGLVKDPTTILLLLLGYMTARVWAVTVKPRHRSWRERAYQHDGVNALERLDFIWISRSAPLVTDLLPSINEVWMELVRAWGEENARRVCRITIYVTDKDADSKRELQAAVAETQLCPCNRITFERPDLEKIVEDHTLELIETRSNSYSVLAFCGSPKLAQDLHQYKINTDLLAAITGHKRHQMEFAAEKFGGVKQPAKPKRSDRTRDKPNVGRSDQGNLLHVQQDRTVRNRDEPNVRRFDKESILQLQQERTDVEMPSTPVEIRSLARST